MNMLPATISTLKSYVTIDNRDCEDIYQPQQTFNLEVKRAQMSNVIMLSGAEISNFPPQSVKSAGNGKMAGKQTLTIGGEDCGTENVILFNGLRIDSRYPPTIMQVQILDMLRSTKIVFLFAFWIISKISVRQFVTFNL